MTRIIRCSEQLVQVYGVRLGLEHSALEHQRRARDHTNLAETVDDSDGRRVVVL
jgi:hypothetical protein